MCPAAGNIDARDSTILNSESPQASSLMSLTEARVIFLLFGFCFFFFIKVNSHYFRLDYLLAERKLLYTSLCY